MGNKRAHFKNYLCVSFIKISLLEKKVIKMEALLFSHPTYKSLHDMKNKMNSKEQNADKNT